METAVDLALVKGGSVLTGVRRVSGLDCCSRAILGDASSFSVPHFNLMHLCGTYQSLDQVLVIYVVS